MTRRPMARRLDRRYPIPGKLLAVSLLMFSLMMSGCKVGPNFQRPGSVVPDGWVGASGSAAPGATTQSLTRQLPVRLGQWWTTFGDDRLSRLVVRAMQSNLDIRFAQARVRQARAARAIAASGFLPTADVVADYSRTGRGGGSVSRGGAGGSAGFVQSGSTSSDVFRAGFDASWELDIWGAVARDVEAAEADVAAAVENRRDVLVSVAAEAAASYIDLRALQRRAQIARQNLESQRRSADLTRRRFQGGFVSRLDLANADAQVATTESQIPLLESAAQQAAYALAVLVGETPGALLTELFGADHPRGIATTNQPAIQAQAPAAPHVAIPGTPPEVPVGLPSDLLQRRADIRRAEAQLHAATARIGVATADLFPRFTLTGSLDVSGDRFAALGNWSSRTWAFGPSVRWPLFDAGRIRANIEVQNAAQEQALLAYRQTILTALREVENALIAYDKEQEHRRSLINAVAANRTAVDLSLQLYTQGRTDFLNVLSAQRSLLLSEDALAQSDRDVANNLVALYKALGGGWETQEAQAAPSTSTQPVR